VPTEDRVNIILVQGEVIEGGDDVPSVLPNLGEVVDEVAEWIRGRDDRKILSIGEVLQWALSCPPSLAKDSVALDYIALISQLKEEEDSRYRTVCSECDAAMAKFTNTTVSPSAADGSLSPKSPGRSSGPFRCTTRKATIQPGKKFEMVLEYRPTVLANHEEKWTFFIPGGNPPLQEPFLLAGCVREPLVGTDRPRVKFGRILVGVKTKETVYLINREQGPFLFELDRASWLADEMDLFGSSSPLTIAPRSRVALQLEFCPRDDEAHNFNIVIKVKRRSAPIRLNVKGYSIFTDLDPLQVSTAVRQPATSTFLFPPVADPSAPEWHLTPLLKADQPGYWSCLGEIVVPPDQGGIDHDSIDQCPETRWYNFLRHSPRQGVPIPAAVPGRVTSSWGRQENRGGGGERRASS